MFFISLIAFLQINCASQNCNNIPSRPSNEAVKLTSNETEPEPAVKKKTAIPAEFLTTFIFVESGEKQCGTGKEKPIISFVKKLEKNKINVRSSKSQDDGKMRAQVCGAPTGKIYVFEINKKDQSQALKLGFKIFEN